jgi:hypothetical protein
VTAIRITLYISLFFTAFTHAQQVSFSKKIEGDNYKFHYKWLDRHKQQQSINLTFTKPALFERFRQLKPYQSEFSHKTIMHAVKKQLSKEPLNEVQAFFLQVDEKTAIKIKGINDKNVQLAYQKVKKIEQVATEQYFKKNYYQFFSSHDGELGVKIDHARVANDSIADFQQVKSIFFDEIINKNVRNITDYVLGFVQSIPYSTLESRITSSGAGFNPPAKLIFENQGDCDSKVTLAATILRVLMPEVAIVIVYIDQHAFIGVAIPASADDIALQHQGINYLLAEPTGPALFRLGELAPESELAINQGRYIAEVF